MAPRTLPWPILAPVLAIALVAGSAYWTVERSSFETFRRETTGVPGAAWFVWSPAEDEGTSVTVALTPGGAALPGAWELWIDSYHGHRNLRAPAVPTQSIAPGVKAPPTTAWRGTNTGHQCTIDDIVWREYVRAGRAPDFDALGCDPALVGTWRCSMFSRKTIDLEPDGRVLDARGVECGRWAGRGRVVVFFFPELTMQPHVTTLCLQDRPSIGTDETLERYSGTPGGNDSIWRTH